MGNGLFSRNNRLPKGQKYKGLLYDPLEIMTAGGAAG